MQKLAAIDLITSARQKYMVNTSTRLDSRVPCRRRILLPQTLLTILVSRRVTVRRRHRTTPLHTLRIVCHKRYTPSTHILLVLLSFLGSPPLTKDDKCNVEYEHDCCADTICDRFRLAIPFEWAVTGKTQSQTTVDHTQDDQDTTEPEMGITGCSPTWHLRGITLLDRGDPPLIQAVMDQSQNGLKEREDENRNAEFGVWV